MSWVDAITGGVSRLFGGGSPQSRQPEPAVRFETLPAFEYRVPEVANAVDRVRTFNSIYEAPRQEPSEPAFKIDIHPSWKEPGTGIPPLEPSFGIPDKPSLVDRIVRLAKHVKEDTISSVRDRESILQAADYGIPPSDLIPHALPFVSSLSLTQWNRDVLPVLKFPAAAAAAFGSGTTKGKGAPFFAMPLQALNRYEDATITAALMKAEKGEATYTQSRLLEASLEKSSPEPSRWSVAYETALDAMMGSGNKFTQAAGTALNAAE